MNSILVISCWLAASASAGLVSVPHVTTTQYHSQDELGQYSYGYSGGPSAKEETRTADGVTRGSYSYIDANGIVQSTSYVSDPVHGFRVAATNLPQAPSPVVTGASVVSLAPAVVASAPIAPAVVQPAPGFDHVHGVPLETPEVVAAKAAHFAAHGEALARLARRWKRSLLAPVVATGNSYSVVTPSGSTTVVAGPSPTGKSFSYSTVAAAPIVSTAPAQISYSAPASTTVVAGPVGKSFSYSTVGATPTHIAVAPASTAVVSGPIGRSFSYSTVGAAPLVTSGPAVLATRAAAATYSAPIVTAGAPLSSRFQSQDEFGQYSYGYSDGLSSKTESRSADGITHGGYSYLDSNGIVQSVKYVADASGFRVHATNLPVGPSA